MRADTIVGYVFAADVWCPRCIARAWSWDGDPVTDPESALDRAAEREGIDRYSESTYDSEAFPKVLFADGASADDYCGRCGDEIL